MRRLRLPGSSRQTSGGAGAPGQQAPASTGDPGNPGDLGDLGALVARLGQVEAEVQELRALGFRVAELADLVTELLGYAADGDDPRFREAVARYADGV